MNFSIRVCGLLASLVLVACGGGGGGSGGGTGGTTAAAVVITSSNSQALAAEALAASSNTDAASGASFVTGVQVDGGSAGFDAVLLGATARKLVSMIPPASALATGVTTSQTVACLSGGSLTMTANSAGSAAIAAGDSVQIVANNCTQSAGGASEVMNGSITITFLAGYAPASTAYPKTLSVRIVTQNFSITLSDGSREVFNGDATMTLTETSATSFTVSLTSNLLSTTVGTHSVTLINYKVNAEETASGKVITMSATVETSNSRLGSAPVSYQVTTVTPITVSSTGVVTSGSIKVTGNGSSLLLTVTSADTFTLQVDSNGDGIYESTSTVTRSQLKAVL